MTFTVEVESSVPAAKMFRAAVLDWHNLGPKFAPEILVNATGLEGEGGVGSVRQLNFTSVMPFSYMKERIDFVDHDKFECKLTLVEGGHLGQTLESASAHFKFEPTGSGGCICKVVTETKPLPGADAGEDEAKAKESMMKVLKGVEAYLQANPDACI